MHDKLVTKINNIDTSAFVLKTASRYTQANLVTKTNFCNKLMSFNEKLTQTKQNMSFL